MRVVFLCSEHRRQIDVVEVVEAVARVPLAWLGGGDISQTTSLENLAANIVPVAAQINGLDSFVDAFQSINCSAGIL